MLSNGPPAKLTDGPTWHDALVSIVPRIRLETVLFESVRKIACCDNEMLSFTSSFFIFFFQFHSTVSCHNLKRNSGPHLPKQLKQKN